MGKGKEVNIFLPGVGWAGDFGIPIAEALGNDFVTHMIDIPGIGRSKGLSGVVKLKDTADWLEEYITENHFEKVNIIGHSLGGIIGLSYANYYPNKVNRLILLDIGYSKIERFPVKMMGTVGYVLPIISVLHRVFGQKALGKESNPDQNNKETGKTEDEIQETIKKLELVDNSFIRTAIQNQPSSSVEGISFLLAAYRANFPKIVKNLKIPCLILYGNREGQSEKHQLKVKKQVTKLRNSSISIQELSGGHYAHISDAQANKYISAFLSEYQNSLQYSSRC